MIDIELDDREVRSALERLQARLADMTPVMKAIATALEAGVEKRFETETDPAGRKWPQLSDATLMNVMRRAAGGNPRKKRGGGTKKKAIAALARKRILYDTGDLLDSLNSSFTRSEARVGFAVDYAIMHQFGAKKGEYGMGRYKTRRGSFPIPWGDVQARPMLPVTRDGLFYGEERERVINILREFLEGSIST